MSAAHHSYSLTPLDTAHTTYLFIDEETGAEKGFGLLTRAREEGERFELRELDMSNMGLIEKLFKQVAVGKSDDQDEVVTVAAKANEKDNEDLSNYAVIKAKVIVKELVNDLVTNRLLETSNDMNKNYVTPTDTIDDEDDVDTVSNYAMMTAEMTPNELVDELMFGFKKKDGVTNRNNKVQKKKFKKKRLVKSSGSVQDEPRSGKNSKLKLPPGWDRLTPAQLAEQMKTVNSLDEDSPDYGRIAKVLDKMEQEPSQEKGHVAVEEIMKPLSNKPRIRKRKREALKVLNKSSLSNPIKLPRNWDQYSPETLATQLKSKVDKNGNSLAKVLENLENVSKNGNCQTKVANPASVIKLPANWTESDPRSLAENIKSSSTQAAANPDLCKILKNLRNKKAVPPARKTPRVVLPANWKEISNQALAANIQAAAAPGQQVSGLLARLAAPVEGSRAACPGTRQAKDDHVRLPADWEESLARPADLADKIKAVNGDKNVPPALLDRLRIEDHKPVERKIRADEPVRLPANWEDSLSRPADLADKIRAVNGDRNVPPALLDRLRRQEHNTGKRKVKVGSSSSPLVLPHNWFNSSSQELARKIKAKLSKTSTSSKKFSELFSRLERKRSQTEMKSARAGPIKLPADWATSSSQELLDKISSCQNVDLVCLSKIQANMTKPRVVESNQTHSSAVILPSNWESSPEDLRKVLEGRKSNNQEIAKILQNLKKHKDPKLEASISKKRSRCRAGRASRSKVLPKSNEGPVFKLPADWSSCNVSELAAKISSSNIGKTSSGLEKIVANLKRSGNLGRQDPPPGQSAPVRLPANWSNCSPQMLAENISKQNLNPQVLSRLLAKLQGGQLPDKQYRNSNERSSKFKKSKKSKRHDIASDPKPSVVKLPANWEHASQQQLAESLKMQNLDASVKSKLLANLACTKQPNMKSRDLSGKFRKNKSSDKRGRNRTGHSNTTNTARREVNTKKPIQLPSDWKSISPDILAQELQTGQSTKEGLGKVIENLKVQKRNSENPKDEGIKKRKVVHQKQTKHVHKKMRKERRQMDKKRRNDEKKNSNEFSTVLKISEAEKARLLKPAQFGWRRECAVGVTGARLTPEGTLVKERIRIDIYYWTPSPISKRVELPDNLNRKSLNIEMKKLGARRIKNIQEMKAFLENKNIERKTGITLENFSFKAKILDLGEFEYERYTELARQHLLERERLKQAMNDKVWFVESLEDVNNEMSEMTQRPEDLFGDISDLEDDLEDMEEELSEELSRKTKEKLSSITIKELSKCAEVAKEGTLKLNDEIKGRDLQSVGLQQDSLGLKDIESTCKLSQDGKTGDQKSKVQKKEKERIRLVVESYDLQLSLSLSVKPKRSVSQALDTFCAKYKLDMEDLQFWCGERRLSGEEKNSSLEERTISVSLAPAKRKTPA